MKNLLIALAFVSFAAAPARAQTTTIDALRQTLTGSVPLHQAEKEEGKKRWDAFVEKLAEGPRAAALAKADELAKKFGDEWRADKEGYSFDCHRHGEYLALFVKRGGEKFATAVNVGATREIKLIEGWAPDRAGTASLYMSIESGALSREEQEIVAYANDGWHTGDGSRRVVMVNYPSLSKRQTFFAPPTPPAVYSSSAGGYGQTVACQVNGSICTISTAVSSYGGAGGSGTVRDYQSAGWTKVPSYPRPAEDDRIVFTGIDATLYVPAGRGREVLANILGEIATFTKARR